MSSICVYAQSCSTLWDPMDCSPPGSFVHGVSQVRILDWVAISYSRGFFWPKDWTPTFMFPTLADRFFTHHLGSLWCLRWRLRKKLIVIGTCDLWCMGDRHRASAAAAAKSLQSCPTLCDSRDGSPPGSPIPGTLQARTLEWIAISFSNAWKWKVKVKSLSSVRLLATPWTAAYQAPPSMGFSRQEYWSGLPLPSPRASEASAKDHEN